jgi:spore coat protein A
MTTPISRRIFLGGAAAGIVAIGVGIPLAMANGGQTSTGQVVKSGAPIPAAFQRKLTIPPALQPDYSTADTDYYSIRQHTTKASILDGLTTELWTYNGSFPGPTIESRSGRKAIVRHTNNLPLPTVVHLHGGHTPHTSDGYPIDYIYPTDRHAFDQQQLNGGSMEHMSQGGDTTAGSRTYTYPLEQRASTLWYHDHRMDFTGPSVWKGLAGFHIVRDDEEDALHLPSGDHEIPLMITDRSFAADGSLDYPSFDRSLVNYPGVTGNYIAGVLGDMMLVNGTPWPLAHVDGATYRFRILNASNARRLSLRLHPAPKGGIIQIGTDGGLLAAPIKQGHLEVAPAERYDVLVDFSGYTPGTAVTMVNDYDTGRMSEVMQFIVGDPVGEPFVVPETLSTIVSLTAAESVVTRSFQFRAGDVGHKDGWLIGGEPFSPTNIAAVAKLGTVEVWELFADFHHPVHIHLSPFQVLSRGSDGPGRFDHGWKDTIDLRPGEQARIAVKFDGYAGKYVFHCHNLEHEDMAMMANFETRA